VPSETGDASARGAAFRSLGWPGWVAAVGRALAVGDRPIVGNRPDALPGPMSMLDSPFRAGMGPGGSTTMREAAPEDMAEFLAGFLAGFLADFLAGFFVEFLAAAAAAVTEVVAAAAGGVHFVLVTAVAVAVSWTELTVVALAATGIWAVMLTSWPVVIDPTVHEAVPSPLAQPLANVGFWLDGCAVSATDTPEADPFLVETCTV
jgi:hypothetical protein